jgi:hypothetical protein
MMSGKKFGVVSFFQMVGILFLTFVTESVIEKNFNIMASIKSLDLNVGVLILIDFAFFFLFFLLYWGIFLFFIKFKN